MQSRVPLFTPAFLVLSLALLLLAGCGGGGGASGDDFLPGGDAGGIWVGEVTLDATTFTSATGLLDQYGNFAIILGGGNMLLEGYFRALASGEIDGSSSSFGLFDFSGELVDNFFYVEGVIDSRNSIQALLKNSRDTRSLTLNLIFDEIYDRPSSLAAVNGNWSYTSGTYTLSLAVDARGVLHGSDTRGCVYNGNLGIVNPNHNIYRAAIDIAACYPVTVSTRGLATLADDVALNDTLVYAVTGYTAPLDRDAFVERLARQ